MYLNHVKNHQILNTLQKNCGLFASNKDPDKRVFYRFTDLATLSNKLQDVSDHELEALLYGRWSHSPDQHERCYSGFTTNTLSRMLNQLEQSDYYFRPMSDSSTALTELSWLPRPISPKRAYALWQERLHHKTWGYRKNLRFSAQYACGRLRAALHPIKLSNKVKVNLGAGEEKYPDYINVDWSKNQDIYDDITKLQRFSDASVSVIYSNHVLEHIPQHMTSSMLQRWAQVLAPGGRVIARMPDARAAIKYLGKIWHETDEQKLMELGFPNYLARETQRTGVLDDDSCIQLVYGWSTSTPYSWDDSNQHKSLWTPELTRSRFEAAGFRVEWCGHLGTLQTAITATR
jgi:SAM-dependent methyltransferase